MTENNRQPRVHYIHRISRVVQERIAGLFILSALLIIVGVVLIQLQSSHLLDDRIFYSAYLRNAQGVSTKTLVNISGIEVGRVSSIDITPDNKIHVQFFVYDRFQRLLRSDSTGELSKLSVIGNTAIIIKAGSHQLPILPAETILPIEEPVSIEELIAQLTPVISSLNDIVLNASALITAIRPEQLQSTTEDLSVVMSNLRNISDQISGGKGLVGRMLYDEQLERDIIGSIQHTTQGIGPIVKDVTHIVKQARQQMQLLDNILRETEQTVKGISPLIPPASELVNSSNKIASELESTAKQVNREIEQLPQLVNKMQKLLDSTSRTIDATQQIWPLSTVIAPASKDSAINSQPLDD